MSFIDQIRHCFVHNDGSLPDIELSGLSGKEVEDIYAFLTSRSRVSTFETTFWDTIANRDVPVDSSRNAAALVANGRAEGFHVCLTGLHVDGVELPELGVFVFDDSIELDYRMGPEWTEAAILAFFELLFQLARIAPTLKLAPGSEGVPDPEAFLHAWANYPLNRSAEGSRQT